jgi:hypothetical protein
LLKPFNGPACREKLSLEEEFVVACARADGTEARRLLADNPNIWSRLSEAQLRQLPNLTKHEVLMRFTSWSNSAGRSLRAAAIGVLLRSIWPCIKATRSSHDFFWNMAQAGLKKHGHGGNVRGILSWVTRNHDPSQGDWVGCARALVEHGMEIPDSGSDYSRPVAEYFATERARQR